MCVSHRSHSGNDAKHQKICSLPPNPGYGDCSSEPVIKFYFDAYDLKCKRFLFLNCKGSNQNRFDTEEECIRVCHYTACRPGEVIALTNSTTPIICEKPSQCSDGFRCSYDKLFRRHVCCGYSNLDRTCPESSVSYASPTQHSALHCSPSPITDQCPGDFVCLKKERAGHCCKPQREYCPLGQSPLNGTFSGHPQKCNLMQSQFACPEGYECIPPYRGNPWGYCCTTKIEARCPEGTKPYLYTENGQPQKCTVGVTTCR
ncbi:Kunitz/Bovine pancreatic trypsin inhibitor domain protein [Ancylostoma duodenale]|uniref:Kunitz/Bovine pancreatic trypsin inhibitor domain protein n=1 Tax=Ancylostoma duodenale TaxID=51022 RepID=A0A0C2D8Y5_9BILA|nr:Kunitz/Bovine pancreatic trypsin inhibitor domain protein [Ancylostoma duodenale]